MRGADGCEVPMVEGGDLGLAQAFARRDDARVNDPQAEIPVLALQLRATAEVGVRGMLGAVGACRQVCHEGEPHIRGEPLVAPIVELGEHQGGDDEVLAGVEQQRRAGRVIAVGRNECATSAISAAVPLRARR